MRAVTSSSSNSRLRSLIAACTFPALVAAAVLGSTQASAGAPHALAQSSASAGTTVRSDSWRIPHATATDSYSASVLADTPVSRYTAGYGWGFNNDGEVGRCKGGSFNTPQPITFGSGTAVKAISASLYYGLALTSTGEVLAWGSNDFGQLGMGTVDGNKHCVPQPVHLPSGSIVTQIAAGGLHALAVTITGAVFAWGSNFAGELGAGYVTSSGCLCKPAPVDVKVPSGVTMTKVAAGGDSYGITSTGGVLAWGNNAEGELGNGTISTTGCMCSDVPLASVFPSGVSITEMAAGDSHALALSSKAEVYAWGYGGNGQLGNHSGATEDAPTKVGLPAGVTPAAVVAAVNDSAIRTSTGGAMTWGYNRFGELGDGEFSTSGCTCSKVPVYVKLPAGSALVYLRVGGSHALGLTKGQRVLAWGFNGDGELGNGNLVNSAVPLFVRFPADVVPELIAAGDFFSLALSDDPT